MAKNKKQNIKKILWSVIFQKQGFSIVPPFFILLGIGLHAVCQGVKVLSSGIFACGRTVEPNVPPILAFFS